MNGAEPQRVSPIPRRKRSASLDRVAEILRREDSKRSEPENSAELPAIARLPELLSRRMSSLSSGSAQPKPGVTTTPEESEQTDV